METLAPIPRSPTAGLVLDVVADFTCPWSFLGTRRIVRAMGAVQGLPQPPLLRWHGFRLPLAGSAAWREHLAQRLPPGITAEFAERSLEEAGRALDIRFDFAAIRAVPDTLHAHRLVLAAAPTGQHVQVADALFRAYFEQGRDIGSEHELLAIAGECALPDQVIGDFQRGFAADGASVESGGVAIVLAEEQRLRALGVQNVPNLLINGNVLVPGPAEEAIYVQALDQVLFPQPAEAQPPRWLH